VVRLSRWRGLQTAGEPLLLKVRVQVEEAGPRLSLQEARRVADIAERAASECRVRLDLARLDEGTLEQLDNLFASAPGPSTVVFELLSPDGKVALLQSQQRIRIKQELIDAVRQICGQQAIRMVA
jgi:hypothetical protein